MGKRTKLAVKHKKTNRGGKSRKNNTNKPVSLSIFGSNANGLNGKIDSLKNALKFYGQPSCVAIQETKLRSNNFKIPGYQVFQKK